MSVAALETAMTAGITAMEAGDWRTAKLKFMAAKAHLIGMPDGAQQGTSHAWDRQAIDKLIEQCAAELGASAVDGGGFRRVPIEYRRPT
jgi:hypothetical protein